MRLFSGHSGALYLLGDDLGGGERPRALLGTAERWQLRIAETVVDNGVLGPADDRPKLATVRGQVAVTLDGWTPESPLPVEAGDEVLVELGADGCALRASTRIPSALASAVKERHASLALNDLEEVPHAA